MESAPMIVLDTHIWLWWINDDVDLLGHSRIDLIQLADIVAVSSISVPPGGLGSTQGRLS